jgi:hypothetical protein
MIMVAVLAVVQLLVETPMADMSQVMTQTKIDTLLLQFEVERVAKHKPITTFPVEVFLRRG